ncbi:hypothetical protein [Peribacillus asahii]|uniref:hypothetical protein n=1 Tax=Peribacillus asahii TaxID=228899 RepID=UPI00207A380E|nr:hypothetical protein [Peribacillus asahii]USK72655.1 hypothetical protein LIS76_23305 [Peribacillus asahii]USK72692.1 hypothetical protein LIS76_23885 [Peribacillus asahii]
MRNNYTFHINLEEFKHVFDKRSLESYLQWSSRDIERLKETIKELEEYQVKVKAHLEKVSSIETEPLVILKRTVNYHNKVEFFVYVKHIPKVDLESLGRNPYITSTDNKRFEGRQRYVAISYAESLARQYECEIKKEGYWK